MQYPWATPGTIVVCVKSTPWRRSFDRPNPPGQQFPQFMRQYTIREVTTIYGGRLVALKFNELRGKFTITAFHPLQTITDEITTEIKETIE